MFEKFFGKKIKYNEEADAIPGQEKMSKLESAHADIEGVLISGEEPTHGEGFDEIQDNFKDNKVSDRSFHISNRRKEEEGENWSVGVEKYLTKHENSRKPEYKDLHSDWKEKVASGELLAEEPETLGKKEIDAQLLDANAEIAGIEMEDGFDLEKAA